MKKIIVFTGAGVSAESGIKTFRDYDGLWENFDINDVATPEAWNRNQDLVQQFYNERRKQLLSCQPNAAHKAIVELEKYFDVQIITQNVDDLHERAGSKNVLHLHGELRKARSSVDENLIYDIEGWEIKKGDLCEKGSQKRPHVVWFGEAVPKMEEAFEIVTKGDIFIIVGTSLNVYPAASLIDYCKQDAKLYLIDPDADEIYTNKDIQKIKGNAGEELPKLAEFLIQQNN